MRSAPIHNHRRGRKIAKKTVKRPHGRSQPPHHTPFPMIGARYCEMRLVLQSDAYLDGLAVVCVDPLPGDEPLRPEQPRRPDLLHRSTRVRAHLHTQTISNPQPTKQASEAPRRDAPTGGYEGWVSYEAAKRRKVGAVTWGDVRGGGVRRGRRRMPPGCGGRRAPPRVASSSSLSPSPFGNWNPRKWGGCATREVGRRRVAIANAGRWGPPVPTHE